MDVFVNYKPFETAFSDYIEKNVKVKVADELNRRAASIIMTAMDLTKKVDPDKIPKEFGVNQIIEQRLFARGKKAGQLSKPKVYYRPSQDKGKVYKILNWRRKFRPDSLPKRLQGAPTGKTKMKGFATKFVKSVRSSCGYIAAGWIPALQEFLSVVKGGKLKTNEASKSLQKRFKYIENNKFAKMGYGMPANAQDIIIKCTFGNAARGASVIGKDPLIKAINAEIGDMKLYIQKEILGLSKEEFQRLNKLSSYMNLFGRK